MRAGLATVLFVVANLVGPPAAPAVAQTASASGAIYLPNITKTLGGRDGWTTPIVVQNAGSTSTVISVAMYRFSDGTLVTTLRSPTLIAGQGWYFDIAATPALPHDTQFSAVVTAAHGEAAAVVIEGSLRSFMSYRGVTSGASTVYLPNITRRLGGTGGWDTPFIVQNLGTLSTTASVSFYEFGSGALALRVDGVVIAPGRSQSFSPWVMDGLADDRQYSVVVEGSAGSQLFAIVNEHQADQAMAYEGLTGGAASVFLPRIVKNAAGWSSPFVVQNLGSAASTVSMVFHRANGAVAGRLDGVPLQAGRSHAVDVRFAPAGLPDGEYSVVVRGATNARLGAIVNQHHTANKAMSYQGVPDPTNIAYIPYVQSRNLSEEWSTVITAQNAGTAAADITIHVNDLGDGSRKASKDFKAVAPGAFVRLDVGAEAGPFLGYSAFVSSVVAVAVVADHVGAVEGDVAMSATAHAHRPPVAAGVDLARTGVTGRIVYTDGSAGSGVTVRAQDWRGLGDGRPARIYGETTTDGSGQFTITGIPPATSLGLWLLMDGEFLQGSEATRDRAITANSILPVADITMTRRYTITPRSGAVVTAGTALTITWTAVPGAGVYCVSFARTQGGFALPGSTLSCGSYTTGPPGVVEVREPRLVTPPLPPGDYFVYVGAYARTAFVEGNPELGSAVSEFRAE